MLTSMIKESKSWDDLTRIVAYVCGNYEGGHLYNYYLSGRKDDTLVITHKDLKKFLQKRFKRK